MNDIRTLHITLHKSSLIMLNLSASTKQERSNSLYNLLLLLIKKKKLLK